MPFFLEKNKLCIITSFGGCWLIMSDRQCRLMFQLVTGFKKVLTMNWWKQILMTDEAYFKLTRKLPLGVQSGFPQRGNFFRELNNVSSATTTTPWTYDIKKGHIERTSISSNCIPSDFSHTPQIIEKLKANICNEIVAIMPEKLEKNTEKATKRQIFLWSFESKSNFLSVIW